MNRFLKCFKKTYQTESHSRTFPYYLIGTREKQKETVLLVQIAGCSTVVEMAINQALDQKNSFPPTQHYLLGLFYGLHGKFGPKSITQNQFPKVSTHHGLPIVAMCFITCLILSTLTAFKLSTIYSITITGGLIFFPITLIFNDMLTEVYGYHQSRKIIWAGVGILLLFIGACQIVIKLPPAAIWPHQKSLETVFGALPQMALASIVAYVVSEFCNSYLIAKLKVLTQGRHFWFRVIVSSSCGTALDSLVFISIAFGMAYDNANVWQLALTQYVIKLSYILIPLLVTYYITGYLKKLDRVDWYDYHTNFNPLALFKIK